MNKLEEQFREELSDDNFTVDIQRYTRTRDGNLYLVMLLDGKKRSNGNGQHNGSESDTKRIFRPGSDGN